MVGRARELERIAELRRTKGHPGVLLSGAAGVGKSRVAREALDAARQGGALVAWVQATTSAASIALGAFADLIPADARFEDRLSLLQGSAQALRDRAAGRPIVLGVDDAQLLDPMSAALVLHLTTSGTAFVIVTVRDGVPYPDAIGSLWKDAGVARLQLADLDLEETDRLLEAALRGPVDHSASGWVYRSSAGNVLYSRELVLGAVSSGALAQIDGLWQLVSEPSLSRSLSELIAERMSALDDDARRVVELPAGGEPLELSELGALTDSAALASVEERGLVSVGQPGDQLSVRLAHPMYGAAVRESLPALRGRDHRLKLAAAVRERGKGTPGDALRVSRWLRDAGEPIPRPMLLDAARAAITTGDFALGAELAERARAMAPDITSSLILAHAETSQNNL